MKNRFLILSLMLFGLLSAAAAQAYTAQCETDSMKGGVYCAWSDGGKSWCNTNNTPACTVENQNAPANPTGGIYSLSCTNNTYVLACTSGYTNCSGTCTSIVTPTSPCSAYDTCNNRCTACVSGYTNCSYSCTSTITPTSPCSAYDTCNNYCTACISGYALCSGTHTCVSNPGCLPGQTFNACTAACEGTVSMLKLGYDSVSGTSVIQSATYPTLYIPSSGYVGLNTSEPNDIFSIGNSGSAPAGSSATGHNFTSSYLSTDDYALANYGLVKTLISSATSSSALWGGTTTGNIWSLASGNVGIGTAAPTVKLDVSIPTANKPGIRLRTTYGAIPGDFLFVPEQDGAGGHYTFGAASIGYDAFNNPNTLTSNHNSRIPGILRYVASTNTASSSFAFGSTASGGANKAINWNFSILANGNVGIGTANPSGMLEVGSSISTNSVVKVTGTSTASNYDVFIGAKYYPRFTLQDTAPGGSTFSFWNLGNQMRFGTNSASVALSSFVVYAGNRGNSLFNGDLALGIYGNDAQTITKNQNIIGNRPYSTYPVVPGFLNLQASGATPTSINNNGGTLSLSSGISTGSGSSNIIFNTATAGTSGSTDVAPTEKMRILGSGNVGIGTTAPNDIFSIGNSGSAPVGSSATGHNFTNSYLSTDDYALVNYGLVKTLIGSSSVLWGGTTDGNIWNLNSGNVGIGTTTPSTKLQINQSAHLNGFSIYGYDTRANDWLKLSIAASGYAYINSNKGYSFQVNGTGIFAVDGTAYIPSNTPWSWGGAYDYSLIYNSAGNRLDITKGKINNTNVLMSFLSSGNVGIGTTAPNDIFSIGNAGSAPAGSSATGHNFTNSYLTTDDYALVNYGLVKTLLGSTSTSLYLPKSGGTMTGDLYMGSTSNKHNITNVGTLSVDKISAMTIDPLYTIKGINYSTFASSIAGGVKEEYVGKIKISKRNAAKEYEAVINFDAIKEGSDLWVWHQVIDFNKDSVDVAITPYGKFAQVYYAIDNNKLIFRSDKAVEISYRLTAKRFDWRKWPTLSDDQTTSGVKIER